MQPPSLVVVAFKPFNGRSKNASLELAKRAEAADRLPAGTQIVQVPVTRGAVDAVVRQALPASPVVPVLWLGETDERASRGALIVETLAVNRLQGTTIEPGKPASIAVLPRDHAARLCPSCDVSRDAGDYLCNYSMWAMHAAPSQRRWVFVHVPREGDADRQLDALVELARNATE